MELIMFVGIPASGKSTKAKEYMQKGYQLISSDAIRAELTEYADLQSLSEKEYTAINKRVFEIIRKETAASLKAGKSVVVDATNLNRKRRMNFLNNFKNYTCKCVLFITPVHICMERNRKRVGNAKVPESAMEKMLCNFECPYLWEGWEEIIPVISEENYKFVFEDIAGFEQDNPHHDLTLDKHLNEAEKYCKDHNYSEMLQKVARYHDIGKVYTKRFQNRKGEPTEVAHYYDHENYSAYLYLTEMCCGKQLTKEELYQILYETNLINCHMRPLNCWNESEKTIEKDAAVFGEKFMKDLRALNQADRAAH